MRKLIRCPACGRYRKESHEKRIGTEKQYNPGCVKYEKTKKVGKCGQ